MTPNVLSPFDFYEQLSDSYDQMISWPNRIGTEGMFFKKLVNDHKLKSSLDIACSTGFHVIMLRRLGLDAAGIDVSPRMIEKAKANSVTCGVTVEYILGDFTTMSKRFSEGFDLVTCLGDTTSHLTGRHDVRKTFEEAYKCLNPGGLFVLQTRNYDHILRTQMRFLPPTGSRNGTEETIFFRLYDFNSKSMNLSVVKFRWHENRWDSAVQTTEIHPYLKKDIEATLKSAGFSKFTIYRNFNYEDYDPNGMDLIIVAEKKGVLKGRATPPSKRVRLLASTAAPKPAAPPKQAVKTPPKAVGKKPVPTGKSKRK